MKKLTPMQMVNLQEENSLLQTLDMDANQWYANNPHHGNYYEAKAQAFKMINCVLVIR